MATIHVDLKDKKDKEQQKIDEEYMKEQPTRMEVANYVNALMENHYVPQLLEQFSMAVMVLQAVLIEKKICTGEEIEEIIKKFNEQRQKELQKQKQENLEQK